MFFPVRTRSATYPDRATAGCTQQVVTRNEQAVHRWLTQGTRPRLTIEAAWPSRDAPVGRVLLQAMKLAGRDLREQRSECPGRGGTRESYPAPGPLGMPPNCARQWRLRVRISHKADVFFL
jgi:hypothetical protein